MSTATNRDMIYRAFGLLSADDAELIGQALMDAAGARLHKVAMMSALGPAHPPTIRANEERGRLRDLSQIATAIADDLRSGRA